MSTITERYNVLNEQITAIEEIRKSNRRFLASYEATQKQELAAAVQASHNDYTAQLKALYPALYRLEAKLPKPQGKTTHITYDWSASESKAAELFLGNKNYRYNE